MLDLGDATLYAHLQDKPQPALNMLGDPFALKRVMLAPASDEVKDALAQANTPAPMTPENTPGFAPGGYISPPEYSYTVAGSSTTDLYDNPLTDDSPWSLSPLPGAFGRSYVGLFQQSNASGWGNPSRDPARRALGLIQRANDFLNTVIPDLKPWQQNLVAQINDMADCSPRGETADLYITDEAKRFRETNASEMLADILKDEDLVVEYRRWSDEEKEE